MKSRRLVARPARARLAVAALARRVWLVAAAGERRLGRPVEPARVRLGADVRQRSTAALAGRGEALPTFTHALTHFDWTLHPARWTFPARARAARARADARTLADGTLVRRATRRSQLGLPAPLRSACSRASDRRLTKPSAARRRGHAALR